MAELRQILGNIFKDIAQARVTSDIYSRNIGKYYEQDPLLRKFPVPRTEISEVEVDLKFIMSGLEPAVDQDENLESSTAPIFIRLARELSDGLFEAMADVAASYADISPDTVRRLLGTEHRIYLSQSLLLYFQRNRGRLVEGGKFNMKEAVGEISKILRSNYEELLEDSELSVDQSRQMEKGVFKRLNIEKQLQGVERPLLEAQKQDAAYTATVEVTADKLAEVPEASISSIKVKAQVRNYMWSKVEHEGKTWRSLNPE